MALTVSQSILLVGGLLLILGATCAEAYHNSTYEAKMARLRVRYANLEIQEEKLAKFRASIENRTQVLQARRANLDALMRKMVRPPRKSSPVQIQAEPDQPISPVAAAVRSLDPAKPDGVCRPCIVLYTELNPSLSRAERLAKSKTLQKEADACLQLKMTGFC